MRWIISYAMIEETNLYAILVYSLKGNTLVLFQYVEKHGTVLHGKMFKKIRR